MTNGASQGLFVIVAVIIFGIFVAISYSLFGGNFKKVMGDIFEDSTQKVLDDVDNVDKSNDNDSNTSNSNTNTADYTKLANVGDTAYYNIRDNIWVLVRRLNDTDLAIISSGTKNNGFSVDNSVDDSVEVTDLVIPEKIFRFNVTTIMDYAFSDASKFTGTFTANSVTTIKQNAFRNSTFTGDLILPNATDIDYWAFQASKFTGTINAPKVTHIGWNAFSSAQFKKGILTNLTNLEDRGNDNIKELLNK